MRSADGTREVAQKFGARVIEMPEEPIVERVRNRAAAECRGDWLMVIDADERVSAGLARRIPELVKATDVTAYAIPRKNYFLGVWLEHGNWPDPQIRLARRGKIRWSELIHEHPEVDGKVVTLPANADEAIEHPRYVTDLGKFVDKLGRYAALDAERLRTKLAPEVWPWILRRPLSEFYGRYLTEGAWRHGMHGLIWSGLMAMYQFQVAVHYWGKSGEGRVARGEEKNGESSKIRKQARKEILRAAAKWLR
jgi:glycosyltransferase involved in cell wall biosynthesis